MPHSEPAGGFRLAHGIGHFAPLECPASSPGPSAPRWRLSADGWRGPRWRARVEKRKGHAEYSAVSPAR
jgi:hypothetical protein